jgi:ABC-type branched-subunit amino acid transport system substrate-binding protein
MVTYEQIPDIASSPYQPKGTFMFQSRSRSVCACVLLTAWIGVSACSGSDVETLTTESAPVSDFASNPSVPSADQQDSGGELEGMRGTSPKSADINAQWIEKISTSWESQGNSKLTDFRYAAAAFDAVVVVALAVEAAGTDGATHADEIVNITVGGTKCTSFAECKLIIDEGGDPDYDGISGPLDFNGNGEPFKGSYAILQYGADNRVDESLTTVVEAALPDSSIIGNGKTTSTRSGDGQLKIGSLLFKDGSSTLDVDPELAGLEYAIIEINNEGGVLGKQVLYAKGETDNADIGTAVAAADQLILENVDVIIGAASSNVTLAVIDKIVAAGITMFSPTNTSPALSNYPDDNLYFRVALPDGLQGATLADLVSEDANTSVYILYINDAYGNGIESVVRTALEFAEVDVLGSSSFERDAASYENEIDAVRTANPDAVVLISYQEGSRILHTAVAEAVGPKTTNWYGTDGVMSNSIGKNFEMNK